MNNRGIELIPNFDNLYNTNKKNEKNKDVKCTISIIGEDEIKNICLNDFKKSTITFGRSDDNDIVISSPLVSAHHGYFNLSNGMILIFDKKSKNGFFINNLKKNDGTILEDGDSIKIDNPNTPLNKGILMVVSIGNEENVWREYRLGDKKRITIGRNENCDITLNRISISSKHAKITNVKDKYIISSYDKKSGIILNDSILTGEEELKDKDVVIIDNIKLIYNKNKILYQNSDYGVKLDAIDVVKTVKVKGKKKNIAEHVDFSASTGEFIAFVGGSGAGKTTFMKCISGITKPTSGTVLINGSELFSNYDVLKNLIGYVPQEDIVFDNLTLIDMLRYAANLRMPDDSTKKEKEQRINEVLKIVELEDKKNVMIKNLSGGQRKRASISVELIADPKLFFLDEPTSGLDPGTERSIMKTLRKMADSGKTIILVTHNTLNLHLCDKVLFFGTGGKLCFDGPPTAALNFFEVDDFVDVYSLINNNPDEWYEKFNNSKYKKYPEANIVETDSKIKKQQKSFAKQFFTLLRRKIKTLLNNKQQILMLFGQIPIISFLFSIVVTENLFYSYEETKMILFSMSLVGIWLGMSMANQEICTERIILKKEYMANLRLTAYMFSKIFYLIIIGLIQAFLLISTFVLIIDVPQIGLIYSWYVEMIFMMFITIFSASAIGLLISVFAKNSTVASLATVLLFTPQLSLADVMIPLEGIPQKISNVILNKWSTETFGIINDLNSLVSEVQEIIPGHIREIENRYLFTIENLNDNIIIILLITTILFSICYYALKRQLESGR